jgi:hypothetical protein
MTLFQIFSVIISAIGLLSAIIGVYVKLKIDLTRIDVQIRGLEREIDEQKSSLANIECINRDDHREIIKKIDMLITQKFTGHE